VITHSTKTAIELLADDMANGDIVSTTRLARIVGINPNGIIRWLTRGVPSKNGGRVTLVAIKRGRQWLTSMGAYKRFISDHPSNEIIESAPTRTGRTVEADDSIIDERRAIFGY
jgi:hypothetical protein